MDTIKELREETGLSFAQIKKALDEANGDKDKAREILSSLKEAQAAKKADREIGAGAVATYLHSSKTMGAMVLLGCETDFVAKNEEFVALSNDIAMHIVAMAPSVVENVENPTDETALLNQPFIKNGELTVGGLIASAIQKFGENIKVVKFERFSI